MTEVTKLITPHSPEDPSLALQVFTICSEAAERAGGYLVPHPAEHTINVVFGGHQVTITVEALGKK
jgi:hypothetical protein